MRNQSQSATPAPADVLYTRCTVDLSSGRITVAEVPCRNLEDVLGGFGRSFQLLAERDVSNALSPQNPLIVNTGLMTGSSVMTGLRTYFSAYSPLKCSNKGLPAAMWSAGSGKFGSKLKWAGIDELIFEGRSAKPVIAVVSGGKGGPQVRLEPADTLRGLHTHAKIMALHKDYADAHFAVIGPAGENFENVYYAAVALSTENELKSGDDKCRFAGRGGMGTMMGYKNLLGIVAQSKDKLGKLTPEIRDLNRAISTGAGSAAYREKKTGGMGGTWSNYGFMGKRHILPENNFRPKGTGLPVKLQREAVEDQFVIRAESCFRCGINCHKNLYEKQGDGKPGAFHAKFDYEPLNLLTTNLGVHDAQQAWRLVALVDNLGMDSISCGATVGYVLDYNERHPQKPLYNGATFGQFEKIMELIEQTGTGKLAAVGRGVKRLADALHEPGYAMHVKGLELPAYLPETNPGYPWAIAGGHMSMSTFLSLVIEKDTSLDYWVTNITKRGLMQVRDDLVGLCKFAGTNNQQVLDAIKATTGLEISADDLKAATRRAFVRGLALERKQQYDDSDYTLPAQVFESPNDKLGVPHFVTREFFAELKTKVWEVFNKDIQAL
ncbi:MAG: aldehyde:ferredoxin oxidoreductase [Candidatus Lambdaproteobacteria bacterium]|nr:aldehyde:ferredoxin oxidoreductase [Candidatus Lambdaproteobacteria bacterium]